jgi:hypothetical protein
LFIYLFITEFISLFIYLFPQYLFPQYLFQVLSDLFTDLFMILNDPAVY